MLCTSAPTQTNHRLNMIEAACINALAGGNRHPDALAAFYARIDPASVLALVRIAKSALSDEELQELGRLMDALTLYVKAVPDEHGAAQSINRVELVLRARQLRSLIGI